MTTTSARDTMTADHAIGTTVAQYLFVNGLTRADLGALLGIAGANVSSRLHGRARWTVDDLLTVANYFGISVAALMPTPDGRGGWIPAPYRPGTSLVPPAGLEPATDGL